MQNQTWGHEEHTRRQSDDSHIRQSRRESKFLRNHF